MYGPGRPAERLPTQHPQPTPTLSHRIDSFASYDSYDSLDTYQLAAALEHDNDPLLDVPLDGEAGHGAANTGRGTTSSPAAAYASPPTPRRAALGRQLSHMFPRTKQPYRSRHQPLRADDPDDDSSSGIGLARLTHLAQQPAGPSSSSPVPLPAPTDAFLQDLHAQEAAGTLTLGLGAGFGPGTRLRLLAGSSSGSSVMGPQSPTTGGIDTLRRTLSRRWTASAPRGGRRRDTLRALAQNEANRRGETVEVVLEDDGGGDDNDNDNDNDRVAAVDLSVVTGPSGVRTATMATTQTSASVAVVAHPQPDWRPAAMRLPYLAMLVVVSAGLGVAQELLYRRAAAAPLVVFRRPEEIPAGLYFAVKYAPTLVAVTFGVLWQGTDCAVKRLEAFYQLSRSPETGAAAEVSLNVDYVASMTLLQPLRALRCGHDAVAVSAAATLLAVSLVPPLAAAAVVLRPDRAARLAAPLGEKQVVVHAVFSRVLTATLGAVALLGAALLVRLQRRRSGLAADVRGIAGLASMAVVSHILHDFRGMDLATHRDIHARLRGRRYVLRNGSLAPVGAQASSGRDSSGRDSSGRRPGGHANPHPLMLQAAGCGPYIACVLLFAGLVPAVVFTPASALLDRAPWLLTALAVAIRLGWGALATAVRMMEPYYRLARRHAPAATLTLDYAATPLVWGALQALRRGHWLVFFVGCGSVMAEVLTVLVSSLAAEGWASRQGTGAGAGAGAGEETRVSFLVSLGLTAFILLYMGAVAAAVLVRRGRPFLPRQPNTIAAVLAFLHQSKLLWAFVGTSRLPAAALRARLDGLGHTYGLGWFAGRDGQTHCGIDHEELLSSYRPGYDYSQSNKPWEDEAIAWL